MSAGPPLPADVWDSLPPEARALILAQRAEVAELRAKVQTLQRQVQADLSQMNAFLDLGFDSSGRGYHLRGRISTILPPWRPPARVRMLPEADLSQMDTPWGLRWDCNRVSTPKKKDVGHVRIRQSSGIDSQAFT